MRVVQTHRCLWIRKVSPSRLGAMGGTGLGKSVSFASSPRYETFTIERSGMMSRGGRLTSCARGAGAGGPMRTSSGSSLLKT